MLIILGWLFVPIYLTSGVSEVILSYGLNQTLAF